MILRLAKIEWFPIQRDEMYTTALANAAAPYFAVARFSSMLEDEWPPMIPWRLAVELVEWVEQYKCLAKVHFCEDNAPHWLLEYSTEFDLYEDKMWVATGWLQNESQLARRRTRRR